MDRARHCCTETRAADSLSLRCSAGSAMDRAGGSCGASSLLRTVPCPCFRPFEGTDGVRSDAAHRRPEDVTGLHLAPATSDPLVGIGGPGGCGGEVLGGDSAQRAPADGW
jgi:hypothetical protein